MITSRQLALAFAATGTLVASGANAQQTVYAIGDGGASLIRFQSNDPSTVTTVANFSGAATFLDAIDFRPATGQLYGYLDSADSFYTVDLNTGQLSLVSAGVSASPTNTFQLGIDFNPTIDRLRVVTDSDQNIVYNPGPMTVTGATAVFYANGDPNFDTDPNLIDIAYSNNLVGAVTSQQYAIDYGIDALVTLANNAGTLVTIGALGVDTDIYTGFDIFTDNGVNTAYAILSSPAGNPGFYTINLATGQATLVGALNVGSTQVYSLAVIPAPGAAVLLAVAGLVGASRRRRV